MSRPLRILAAVVAALPGCTADTLGVSDGPPTAQDTGMTTVAPTGAITVATDTPAPTDALASSDTGDDTTGGPQGPHPELYPFDRVHSPITEYVAGRMRAIDPHPDTVTTRFSKIGGTSTASDNFMHCLADDPSIMGLPVELQATRDYFDVDLGAGLTPYTRASLAAALDASAMDCAALVTDEILAIRPRFAHVLIGTHDLADAQPAGLYFFADYLLDIVDELMMSGVVPILSTIPQRTDLPAMQPYVPRYNAVIRAAAQGRQIPLVDLEYALRTAPMQGLGPDGVDLSVFTSAMVDRPCYFDEAALQSGYNLRNLESLRALDRARRVVIDQEPELDAPLAGLPGSGTIASPFEVPSLPFVHLRSTAASPSDAWDAYGGACDDPRDESGPEVLYHLNLDAAVDVRAAVFDREGTNVDIHLLTAPDPGQCLKSDDQELTGPLPGGSYWLAVDSYAGDVPNGAAGEYMLVILAE